MKGRTAVLIALVAMSTSFARCGAAAEDDDMGSVWMSVSTSAVAAPVARTSSPSQEPGRFDLKYGLHRYDGPRWSRLGDARGQTILPAYELALEVPTAASVGPLRLWTILGGGYYRGTVACDPGPDPVPGVCYHLALFSLYVDGGPRLVFRRNAFFSYGGGGGGLYYSGLTAHASNDPDGYAYDDRWNFSAYVSSGAGLALSKWELFAEVKVVSSDGPFYYSRVSFGLGGQILFAGASRRF